MPRTLPLVLLMAVLVGCGPANSQTADDSEDRKARIIANLKHEFPQIANLEIRIDTLKSASGGMDEGQILIDGQAPQPFLISRDDTALYLIASEAIDASRTMEDLAAAQTEADQAAVEEARERGLQLAEATAGLPVRGNPDAPVTIIEFSDFECPYCRLASSTIETVLEQYPDDVKIVYAHFPLGNHPWATPAAIASTCAAQQDNDAFWTLHDLYFADQRVIETTNVIAKSRAALANAGIDLAAWETCATDESSPAYQGASAAVTTQSELGDENGVRGTPAFFVNGRFVNGNQPLTVFVEAIEAARADLQ
ncbi:MAG: thioredoxin domain-containing protein [Bacteroidota bacterium]